MRTGSVPLSALLLLSCAGPEERAHQALMDKIEAQVRLPKGARPLAEYSRYYAKGDRNEIVAIYLIVPKPGPQPEGSVPPGNRRWFNDIREVPAMSGGGCG